MRRVLTLLLVLPACNEHDATTRRAVEPVTAPGEAAPGDASVIDATPGDASVIDATFGDAVIDALSGHAERAQRLAPYLELLSIDRWTFELLATFPGVPEGKGFFSLSYSQWDGGMWMTPETLRDHLAKVRQAAELLPRMAVDDAVGAYLEVQGRWLDCRA